MSMIDPAFRPIIDSGNLSVDAMTISQQLVAYSADYQHRCIVIIDPFLTPVDDEIMTYFATAKRFHPVCILHPSILASKRPLLLELNLTEPFERQALSYIIEQALSRLSPYYVLSGLGQQYCAWLFSRAEVAEIAGDMARLALQKNQQDKMRFLRFYDPAVFRQLMSVLNQLQRNKLYGRIEKWVLLDRYKQLIVNQNTSKPRPVLSGELGLTDAQFNQLFCIGINNQLLTSMQLIDPTNKIDEITALSTITPCLLRMLQKQYTEAKLLVDWAKLALKFGRDFDLVPLVQNEIQKIQSRRDFYPIYQKLNQLSQSEWQQFVKGIENE